MLSKLIALYLAFLQVGAFAFGGGLATLPLLHEIVVVQNGWLSEVEWVDVFTISNMTPGPIAINAATFVGTKLVSVPGALVATAGVITPQIILITILSHFLFSGKEVKVLDRALKGLKPGVVGLIAVVSLNMFLSSLFPEALFSDTGAVTLNILREGGLHIDLMAAIMFVVSIILLAKKKVSMFKLLIAGAAFGVLMQFVLP